MTSDRPTMPADLLDTLDLLAGTIVHALGFGVAVVNLARPDGSLEAVSIAGDDAARDALLGTVGGPEVWDRLLDLSEQWGGLRFLDHHEDTGDLYDWIPDLVPVDHPDAWHPEDALFAPLTARDGSRLGILSVDLPPGGLRPDAATRGALEAFAVSAALAIEHAKMRQWAEASEVRFKQRAMHDPLTGLANRDLLLSRLRHAVGAHHDDASVTALVFIDIDMFKAINDAHSHAVGDEVLMSVAAHLRDAVRGHDTVARWGGDEFLVLLNRLPDEATVLEVVQRMAAAIARPLPLHDRVVEATASLGVCLWPTNAVGQHAEELIRRADAAMYHAKSSGRNRYAVFDALSEAAQRRHRLVDLISRAVAEQRVVVHYQPIVRTEDGVIVGVEALCRLRDDDGSLLEPADFLELATSNDLLIPIEHEVIHRACAQVASWNRDGHDLRLAVNVCVVQLTRIIDFEATVAAALVQSALEPASLVFEITEHALLSLSQDTIDGISRLVGQGVRFSVDDFGTGYGSLTYVHALPIHELKVDRSFVTGSDNVTTRAILRSIATLAGDLGMNCVAEGVETQEQREIVGQSNIPEAQGWFFSHPLAPEDLAPLLASSARSLTREERPVLPGDSAGS